MNQKLLVWRVDVRGPRFVEAAELVDLGDKGGGVVVSGPVGHVHEDGNRVGT